MHFVFRALDVVAVEFDDGDRLGLVVVPRSGVPFDVARDDALGVSLCSPVKAIANGTVTWRHAEITAAPGDRFAWAWIADDSDRVLAVIDYERWTAPHPPETLDVTVTL
jgi:hypothetical protein